MKKRLFVFVLIACLSTAGLTFAQVTGEGRIAGKVVDGQGAPLPGVSVKATSPRLVGSATTVTDGEGVYRLMALPSGTYEITFAIQGFKTLVRQNILLELSQTLALNVTMQEATIEEQVTVIGESPLIDVKSTVKGQTMTKETYMALPRGRSFDSLISTIPGVQNESITGGISVDGASGAENMFYVDGADITDFHLGVKGQNVVLELLDEVKVTASGYNAEFGGSMGGVVNVISRTGGNEFHGDLMGFYENNTRLMQGYARDLHPHNPDDDYLYEYVNNDTQYFERREPRRLQPLRGRLQPRRLHHQGQAVVLRLGRRGLRPDLGPARLQPPRGAVLDLPEPELRLQRVRQADRGPLRGPARCRPASSTTSPSTAAPCPSLVGTTTASTSTNLEGMRLSQLDGRADRGLLRRQQRPAQLPGRLASAEREQPADPAPRRLDLLFLLFE